jgi:hypothetical protein
MKMKQPSLTLITKICDRYKLLDWSWRNDSWKYFGDKIVTILIVTNRQTDEQIDRQTFEQMNRRTDR